MDINNDDILDIISGSYKGHITLYKGSKDGFEPPVYIDQSIDFNDKDEIKRYGTELIATNPTFADFNNDGLLDAFTGGVNNLKVIINKGGKDEPIFNGRRSLVNTSGEFFSNSFKKNIIYVDWDGDGVGDIISSGVNNKEKDGALHFYKGVSTKDGVIFKNPIPLIISLSENHRAIPGENLTINLADINGDGKKDILLGATLLHAGNENKEIYWDASYRVYDSPKYLELVKLYDAEMNKIDKNSKNYMEDVINILKRYFPEQSEMAQGVMPWNRSMGVVIVLLGK